MNNNDLDFLNWDWKNIRKVEKIVYCDIDSFASRILMRWVRLHKLDNVTFKEFDSKTTAIRSNSDILVKVPVLKVIFTFNDNSVKKEYFFGNVKRIAKFITEIN